MTIFLLFKDWELQIKGVSSYDSVEYHCQATTHHPSFISVILTVVGKYQKARFSLEMCLTLSWAWYLIEYLFGEGGGSNHHPPLVTTIRRGLK